MIAAAQLRDSERAALREVYQEGGTHDYVSQSRLVYQGLVQWDRSARLYRLTDAGSRVLAEMG